MRFVARISEISIFEDSCALHGKRKKYRNKISETRIRFSGGVFDQGEDSGLDVHLTQAVDRINQDASILRGHQLKALSFKTNPGDSFVASKCGERPFAIRCCR